MFLLLPRHGPTTGAFALTALAAASPQTPLLSQQQQQPGMGTNNMAMGPVNMGSRPTMGNTMNVPSGGQTTAVDPNVEAQIRALGPVAMQNFQTLRNPNHPITQYLNSQVPNFAQLPIMQQLQRMHSLQVSPISGNDEWIFNARGRRG